MKETNVCILITCEVKWSLTPFVGCIFTSSLKGNIIFCNDSDAPNAIEFTQFQEMLNNHYSQQLFYVSWSLTCQQDYTYQIIE